MKHSIALILLIFVVYFVCAQDINETNARGKDGRIIGGSPIEITAAPYHVYLAITVETGTVGCSGSIISDRFILTAAHCTRGALAVTVRYQILSTEFFY